MQRRTNLDGREVGDASSAQSVQSHAQYGILGFLCRDRPSSPGINQWYQAVYLRSQDERRIWLPTYKGAPNTLRVVPCEQAAKQLVLDLQRSWLGVLESEATARKSSF